VAVPPVGLLLVPRLLEEGVLSAAERHLPGPFERPGPIHKMIISANNINKHSRINLYIYLILVTTACRPRLPNHRGDKTAIELFLAGSMESHDSFGPSRQPSTIRPPRSRAAGKLPQPREKIECPLAEPTGTCISWWT